MKVLSHNELSQVSGGFNNSTQIDTNITAEDLAVAAQVAVPLLMVAPVVGKIAGELAIASLAGVLALAEITSAVVCFTAKLGYYGVNDWGTVNLD